MREFRPVPYKEVSLPVLLAYLLPAVIFLLSLAFLTKTYYWDGVLFAINIEAVHAGQLPAVVLFHPNHLLYTAFGYALYSGALALGLHVRAITIMQIANVIFSAAAGWTVYLLAKRFTRSHLTALFCWILFAAGANWWKFSTDADAYIIAVLLLLLALLSPNFLLMGTCHALAMLFHELSIFFYVPVLAAIMLDKRRSTAARFGVAAAYVAGTALVVTAVYLACYSLADHRTYPTLLRWVSSYDTRNTHFTQSVGHVIGSYLSGFLKLFLGGKIPLIHDYFSPIMALAFAVCLLAFVAAFRWFKAPATPVQMEPARNPTLFLWLWLGTYAVFLASWDAGSTFHKLFVWPPIVLLIGVAVARKEKWQSHAIAFVALSVAVAAWNFGAFIYPHSHESADPVLMLAKKVDKELPRNATIVYTGPDSDSWYLNYFAPGRRWVQIPPDPAVFREVVRTAPGPVCMDLTALPTFPTDIDPHQSWDLIDKQRNVRLDCIRR